MPKVMKMRKDIKNFSVGIKLRKGFFKKIYVSSSISSFNHS